MLHQVKIAHQLKGNKRPERPRQVFFVDTETLPETISDDVMVHNFRLACGTYWRIFRDKHADHFRYYHFKSITEVWDTIDKLVTDHTTLHVVAHNWSFDLQVLGRFGYLYAKGWRLDFSYEKGRVVLLKLKLGSRKLVFVDDMNFFPGSLAELGKDVGLPKLKMPDFSASDDVWYTYCDRDVAIMVKAWGDLFSFLDQDDLGSWKPTAASLSQSIYRHKFMKQPIFIHANTLAIKLERESYHGARTEARRIGKFTDQPFYYLDVNSMYPAVMKLYQYPYNLRSYLVTASVKVLQDYIDTLCIIAEVELDTDEPVYAHKVNGKLIFPVGRFSETLTTEAIRYALAHDHICKVGKVAFYDKAPLFVEFVDYFYSARLQHRAEGNLSFARLDKLILNSSYGKWGQRNDDWAFVKEVPQQEYELWHVIDAPTQSIRTYRIHDGIMEMHEGYHEPFNSFVAIASETTTNARLYLYDIAKIIGDDHVYYYDTDGFIVDAMGYAAAKGLVSSTELGKLKVDRQANSLDIRGLKDYRFGDYERIKGVSPRADKLDDNTFSFWQKAKKGSVVYSSYYERCAFQKVRKELKRRYNKGIKLPDGQVQPLIVNLFKGYGYLDIASMIERYGVSAVYDGHELIPMDSGKYYDPMLRRKNGAVGDPRDQVAHDIEKMDNRHNNPLIKYRRV